MNQNMLRSCDMIIPASIEGNAKQSVVSHYALEVEKRRLRLATSRTDTPPKVGDLPCSCTMQAVSHSLSFLNFALEVEKRRLRLATSRTPPKVGDLPSNELQR